jgi:hypothetical protein
MFGPDGEQLQCGYLAGHEVGCDYWGKPEDDAANGSNVGQED